MIRVWVGRPSAFDPSDIRRCLLWRLTSTEQTSNLKQFVKKKTVEWFDESIFQTSGSSNKHISHDAVRENRAETFCCLRLEHTHTHLQWLSLLIIPRACVCPPVQRWEAAKVLGRLYDRHISLTDCIIRTLAGPHMPWRAGVCSRARVRTRRHWSAAETAGCSLYAWPHWDPQPCLIKSPNTKGGKRRDGRTAGCEKNKKSIPNFSIFHEEFGSSAALQTLHGSTPQSGHKSGQGVFIGGVQQRSASKTELHVGAPFGTSGSASAWVHARQQFRVQLPEENPNTETHSGKHFGGLAPPSLWPPQAAAEAAAAGPSDGVCPPSEQHTSQSFPSGKFWTSETGLTAGGTDWYRRSADVTQAAFRPAAGLKRRSGAEKNKLKD